MKNVLYFSTPWCGPCKMFKQNKLMAEQYGVSSVPAIVVVDDAGQVVTKLVGVQPKAVITNLLSTC